MKMTTFMTIMLLTALVGGHSSADEKQDMKKATEQKLAEFEYPGSKRFQDDNVGTIAQLVLVTPDEFEKVDEWYRKALGINKAMGTGVSDMPWPTGAKGRDSKGQQQRSVFQDEVRPKGNNMRELVMRAPTTRTYVSRTPERTIVVIINRGPDDKQTVTSVVLLPEGAP